MALILGNPI